MKFTLFAGSTLAVLLTGCAVAPAPAPDIHGTWVIEQARAEPILDKRRARLVLGRDGRLSGHNSCNAMSGSFTLEGDRIRIGPIATTRMACAELQREQEDRILTALELAVTARVRPDGLLEIRDADGRGLLRATREPQ
ncbi:MAG: META domain-containing protein [Piscinibacter sp.]|uniref:META domain-containing protein n=1 Tax=Piscinibacter sp. TaxID=1903157 RepID=UPI003D0BBD26